jgi:AcrR family transcriptional regulator
MARTQAADYEQQRDAILDAAAATFAKYGFAGSSMAMLGAVNGASKARLYHYYAGKDAILFDLLDRYTQRLVAIARAAWDEAGAAKVPAAERLAAMVRAFMREYATSQTRHIVLLHDVDFLEEPERTKVRGQEREIVRLFRDAIALAYPGRIPQRELTAHTMMLFGMINWTFTWLKPQGPVSHAEFAESVLRVLRNGFGGKVEPGLPANGALQEIAAPL